MIRYAESLIHCTLYLNVALYIVVGVAAAAKQIWILVLFAALGALLSVCYMYAVRPRIPFASANLKVACSAIEAHKSMIFVAYLMIVIESVWVGIWGVGAIGVYSATGSITPVYDSQGNQIATVQRTSSAIYFLLLVSFYWGCIVCANIVHCRWGPLPLPLPRRCLTRSHVRMAAHNKFNVGIAVRPHNTSNTRTNTHNERAAWPAR